MLEIERKFIMQDIPEKLLSEAEYKAIGLLCVREVEIEQGYLSMEPEVRLHAARDTKTKEKNYRLTLKGDGDLTRTELITDVSYDFYMEAKKMLPGGMIEKLYRKYQYGSLILEVCHVDTGTENEFFYGEIEFESEEAAKAFIAPEWLGKEVTYDNNYKMKNYWKRTRL